ncbi:MAG: FAD-dependent oxidoreductase, partial [Proteobacteria bacterium]|nr:FAD-dependent oxidoreductase [Pseudomonadota bacterium]
AWRVEARGPDGERERVTCAAVVNAAGLWADRVAELAGIDVDARGLRQRFCKGDTFALAPGRTLNLSHLIYPLPSGGGLGIHATAGLDGRIHFGPDAEYVAEPSYQVDPDKADRFAESVSRYLPALRADWLVPEMAGLRPRLHGPGEEPRDFAIEEESHAGLPGLVNCIGIESPGLTAAPAIAERIAHRLDAL